jgi:hypothetical protein
MVFIVTAATAQVSDTASLNYNNPATVKDTHNESPPAEDDSERDRSQVGASSGVREGTISSEDQAQQQLPKPNEEQTDQKGTTNGQPASDAGKREPKRDKSFLKKGNAYYKDDPGEKKKRKKSRRNNNTDND